MHVGPHESCALLCVDSFPCEMYECFHLRLLERLGSDYLLRSDPRLRFDHGGLEHPGLDDYRN